MLLQICSDKLTRKKEKKTEGFHFVRQAFYYSNNECAKNHSTTLGALFPMGTDASKEAAAAAATSAKAAASKVTHGSVFTSCCVAT